MASIRFDQITRKFPGQAHPALDNFTLDVEDGEFLVLVGPSGCGKSTTLRLLAGMDQPTSGRISINGEDITDLHPKDRDTAMVFQNYALYPHMSVADNIGFALKMAKVPAAERQRRIHEVAKMLYLSDVLDRKPAQLSGGQRQRAAMGRALVRTPQAFLLDEPLSNLDASLRVRTRAQISELTQRLKITTLYVTHDQTEAMTMGDRVAVLKNGLLHQVDSPQQLYRAPADAFTAHFLGTPGMNLMVSNQPAEPAFGSARLHPPASAAALAEAAEPAIIVGIRPEDVQLTSETEGQLQGEVVIVESLGTTQYVYVCPSADSPHPLHRVAPELIGEEDDGLEDQPPLIAVQLAARQTPPAEGERVSLTARAENFHFFHPVTGARVR